MDANKTPDPLPVTAAKNKIPAAVRRASDWALATACITFVAFAVGLPLAYHVPCSQSAFVLRCVQWTDAESAEGLALGIGMLCCALLQAAAAALALQLPCRSRWVRRALAYLALAVTTVGHCMYAAAMHLSLAADPGDLFGWMCYPTGFLFFAWGDVVNFLVLLGGED